MLSNEITYIYTTIFFHREKIFSRDIQSKSTLINRRYSGVLSEMISVNAIQDFRANLYFIFHDRYHLWSYVLLFALNLE